MNYITWAAEYDDQNKKVMLCIEKEKAALKAMSSSDEIKEVNRRIAILRSIYKQNKLTADFLRSRGKRYGDHITEKPVITEVSYGKDLSA